MAKDLKGNHNSLQTLNFQQFIFCFLIFKIKSMTSHDIKSHLVASNLRTIKLGCKKILVTKV